MESDNIKILISSASIHQLLKSRKVFYQILLSYIRLLRFGWATLNIGTDQSHQAFKYFTSKKSRGDKN